MNCLESLWAHVTASGTSILSKAKYGAETTAAILVIALAGFLLLPKAISLCGVLFDPVTTVQRIQVSEALSKQGYSEAALQQMLIDALDELRADASGVTPKADTEKVLSEFKMPDIELPGTGMSLRPLLELARTLLKRDSTVYGSVVDSASGFAVMLTLREPDGRTVPLHSDSKTARDTLDKLERGSNTHLQGVEAATLKEALREAAAKILEHQSPLLYASYLTALEQKHCLERASDCNFTQPRNLFAQIAAGAHSEGSHENAAWAKLALSKLATYEGDYDGTVRLASDIVKLSDKYQEWKKVRPWAYYNWGVALNDLGCYQQAAEVLRLSVTERTDNDPAAHNALARSFLALATVEAPAIAERRVSGASKPGNSSNPGGGGLDLVIIPPVLPALLPQDHRDAAIVELDAALDADPGYQEAYVNLGDALQLDSADSSEATVQSAFAADAVDAYRLAVDLNVNQADRAYERLTALHDPESMKVAQRIAQNRPQCQKHMARSLLESWGCSDKQIEAVSGHIPPAPHSATGGLLHTAAGAAAEPAVCSKYNRSLPQRAPVRRTATTDVKWTASQPQHVPPSPSGSSSDADNGNHGA